MKEEKHVIVDVSTPKNEEEKDKVTKAKIVANLQLGAMMSITVGIVNCINIFGGVAIDNILSVVMGGIGLICSGVTSYDIISTISKYKQSDLDSELTNTESEGKTR